MKGLSPLPKFPVSQRVYGRLLLAYPQAHRAVYGPAMAQLFRDQCRAAWNESRYWGLLKFWLRVLPDLASTSILERLAALNGRKSMTEKLTSLFGFHPTTAHAFFRVFVPVFVLVLGASVAITYLLPESYASTARVRVERVPRNAAQGGQPNSPDAYDPYFLQTEFEIMQSAAVLTRAVEKLNLAVVWGKKYCGGPRLKTEEAVQLLQARLDLHPVRNTYLIEIRVFSEDRLEAARLANAVAEAYRDYRQEQRQQGFVSTSAPPAAAVEIVASAAPGLAPVLPNKPRNITLGAMAGILLASVAGAIGAAMAFQIRKRMHKATPATG